MRVRLKAAIVVGALGVAASTTVALAEWSSSATGTGTAQSSHDSPSHITASAFAPDLYPGASNTVMVSVDNPNPYPVVVTSISSGTSAAQTGGLGTCSANSVTSDSLAPVGGAAGVLQSDGTTMTIAPSGSATFQLTTHMVANADNGCQGLTFTLPLTATLASNA